MRTLLCLALIALSPHTTDASCMRAELGPNVMTRRSTQLPADGGVLVGYTMSTTDNYEEHGADPSDVKWTGTENGKPIKLTRVELAPGLSVYTSAASKFQLAGKRDHGSFTRDANAKPVSLAAPVPGSITEKVTSGFRSTTTTTTLHLGAAPPADAVAIIAYDANGKAQLFATLPDTHDKLRDLEIDQTGGHCGTPQPPGHGYLTGKVTFAYVDQFGRLSPQSKAISP